MEHARTTLARRLKPSEAVRTATHTTPKTAAMVAVRTVTMLSTTATTLPCHGTMTGTAEASTASMTSTTSTIATTAMTRMTILLLRLLVATVTTTDQETHERQIPETTGVLRLATLARHPVQDVSTVT